LCPGWHNAVDYNTQAQAKAICMGCDDCHGIFSSSGSAKWHYCSKDQGITHKRGKWGSYQASFKSDSCDATSYCFGNFNGAMTGAEQAQCKPDAQDTHAPTPSPVPCTSTVAMGPELDQWACGGNGQDDSNLCPGWNNAVDYNTQAQANAICMGCDDCHGIFSGTSSAKWHYCSKDQGITHKRGKWGSYKAFFKSDSCDSTSYCFGNFNGAMTGAEEAQCKPDSQTTV
jgi:ferredoxin-like protein FixX